VHAPAATRPVVAPAPDPGRSAVPGRHGSRRDPPAAPRGRANPAAAPIPDPPPTATRRRPRGV